MQKKNALVILKGPYIHASRILQPQTAAEGAQGRAEQVSDGFRVWDVGLLVHKPILYTMMMIRTLFIRIVIVVSSHGNRFS